ncbi:MULTISPECIES: sigma-70 family RNA polymerase sigma factor [unclassified Fusibacter]|uniref:sigma-70 family RNA polymerase sigma factor n=1 Tax=unclassified Fusibacter TaxID=2624464 RepID=UPI0010117C17|nr:MULTISPECIES: sigma-70 family RNA polymerase sigma factor [unclassified Fusibacter]MCK8061182.1 sigma-70 family RNA polymerase sigma factor [Fusibacter sp. A2]NPE23281.1 sigma-70 family RNA polymerase sigma factor [Fusibacter sp. A1]RXV59324.1 hypothetical protein DWB64_15790 [Fusibacter sp. A1]
MIKQDILDAQNDKDLLNALIASNREYIKKIAGRILNKHIDVSNDDAYAIAMYGFYEALRNYDENKGSFNTFVYAVIRNRLYDYGRIAKRTKSHEELTVDTNYPNELTAKSVDEFAKLTTREELQLEILNLSNRLREFDINYLDLVHARPKANKTKQYIIELFKDLDACESAYKALIKTHRLQIKAFENMPDFNRKRIERHRSFIISKLIIFFEDFPQVKSFIDWG